MQYGLMDVVRTVGKDRTGHTVVHALCECGNAKDVLLDNLRGGRVKSCGCVRSNRGREIGKTLMLTHGETHSLEFRTWQCMRQRCSNPNNASYANYGGRGIKVCARWELDYENFLEDMGRRPAPHYSIERDDNNGNYEPENCRWATPKEQAQNRRHPGEY